jgi:hypothetical protein
MDSIPFILILIVLFSLMFVTEFFKIKKEVRKNTNLLRILKKELSEIKSIKKD